MTTEAKPKRPGFCSLCGKPIAEIKQTWTEGAKKGEPREFGQILPHVKKTTVVMRSGAQMDWLFCRGCSLTPKTLPFVWKRMLLALTVETDPGWREIHDLGPYTPEQYLAMCAERLRSLQDPPIGIFGTRRFEGI